MENPIKMDDLGGNPPIFRNIHISVLKALMAFCWNFGHSKGALRRPFSVGQCFQNPSSQGMALTGFNENWILRVWKKVESLIANRWPYKSIGYVHMYIHIHIYMYIYIMYVHVTQKKRPESEVLSCGGGCTVLILKFWYLAWRRGCRDAGMQGCRDAGMGGTMVGPCGCLKVWPATTDLMVVPTDLMSFW